MHDAYDSLFGTKGTAYIYNKIGGWAASQQGSGPLSAAPTTTQGWPTGSGTIALATSDFKVETYAPGGTGVQFPSSPGRSSQPTGAQVSFYDGELIRIALAWVPYENFTSTRIVNVTGAELALGPTYTTSEPFTSSNNNFWRYGQYLQSDMYLRIKQNGSDTFGFTISTPSGYKNFQYSGGKIGSSRINVLQQAYDSIPEKIKVKVSKVNPGGGFSYPIDETHSINSSSGSVTSGDFLELKKASLSACFSTGAAGNIAADEFALSLSSYDNVISFSPSSNDFGMTNDGAGHVRLALSANKGVVNSAGFIDIDAASSSITQGTYQYRVSVDQTTPTGSMPYTWMAFPTIRDATLTWGIPTTGAGFQLSEGQATQDDNIIANTLVYGSEDRVTNSSNEVKVENQNLRVEENIRCNGDVTAFYSDERLKTRTGIIENAMEKVRSLEGFYYTENSVAKSLGYNNDKLQVGLSAQQVESIMPEAVSRAPVDIDFDEEGNEVSKTGENYLTVNYSKLVPLLLEGIKEQQDKIEELTERIGKLEE